MYIFSGSKVIAEYDNGAAVGSPTREYIYSGSSLVAKIESGATTYHHPDHLSTRVTTDTSSNVARTFGHYPFGETWYETGVANKWKFTSYERDGGSGESGNDYAMMRSYVNRLARFPSADPIAGSLFNPQSLNRYAYVRNDPINLVDPLGLFHSCPPGCTPIHGDENGDPTDEGCDCPERDRSEDLPRRRDPEYADPLPVIDPGQLKRGRGLEADRQNAKDKLRERCAAFLAAVLMNLYTASNAAARTAPDQATLQAQADSITPERFEAKVDALKFVRSAQPSRFSAEASFGSDVVTIYPKYDSYSQKAALLLHESFHTLSGGSWTDPQLAAAANVPVTRRRRESDEDYRARAGRAFDNEINKYCGDKKP